MNSSSQKCPPVGLPVSPGGDADVEPMELGDTSERWKCSAAQHGDVQPEAPARRRRGTSSGATGASSHACAATAPRSRPPDDALRAAAALRTAGRRTLEEATSPHQACPSPTGDFSPAHVTRLLLLPARTRQLPRGTSGSRACPTCMFDGRRGPTGTRRPPDRLAPQWDEVPVLTRVEPAPALTIRRRSRRGRTFPDQFRRSGTARGRPDACRSSTPGAALKGGCASPASRRGCPAEYRGQSELLPPGKERDLPASNHPGRRCGNSARAIREMPRSSFSTALPRRSSAAGCSPRRCRSPVVDRPPSPRAPPARREIAGPRVQSIRGLPRSRGRTPVPNDPATGAPPRPHLREGVATTSAPASRSSWEAPGGRRRRRGRKPGAPAYPRDRVLHHDRTEGRRRGAAPPPGRLGSRRPPSEPEAVVAVHPRSNRSRCPRLQPLPAVLLEETTRSGSPAPERPHQLVDSSYRRAPGGPAPPGITLFSRPPVHGELPGPARGSLPAGDPRTRGKRDARVRGRRRHEAESASMRRDNGRPSSRAPRQKESNLFSRRRRGRPPSCVRTPSRSTGSVVVRRGKVISGSRQPFPIAPGPPPGISTVSARSRPRAPPNAWYRFRMIAERTPAPPPVGASRESSRPTCRVQAMGSVSGVRLSSATSTPPRSARPVPGDRAAAGRGNPPPLIAVDQKARRARFAARRTRVPSRARLLAGRHPERGDRAAFGEANGAELRAVASTSTSPRARRRHEPGQPGDRGPAFSPDPRAGSWGLLARADVAGGLPVASISPATATLRGLPRGAARAGARKTRRMRELPVRGDPRGDPGADDRPLGYPARPVAPPARFRKYPQKTSAGNDAVPGDGFSDAWR